MVGLLRWTLGVVWSAVAVGAVVMFAIRAGAGLHWSDVVYLFLAMLAVREVLDLLFD